MENYILFYPDAPHQSLMFHIQRHIFIIFFMYLAFIISPCFFTIFLFLLSTLEYSRRAHFRGRAFLLLTITFGLWVIFPAFENTSFLKYFPTLMARSLSMYIPILLDSILYNKISLNWSTDFVFPILIAGASHVLSDIDPIGIAAHPTSFCTDYPDFTFLPLRVAGPSFLSFIIALLACACSRWRSTHIMPRYIIRFLFQVIPTLIVVVYFGRFYWESGRKEVKIGAYTASLTCSEAANMLRNGLIRANLTVFGSDLKECTPNDISAFKEYSKEHLVIADMNGSVAFSKGRELHAPQNDTFLVKDFMRILVLRGDEMLDIHKYLSHDADIILSLDLRDDYEKRNYPERTAMVIAQTTGAHRIHIGNTKSSDDMNRLSYLVNAAGHFIFREQSTMFLHTTKLAPNVFYFAKCRHMISTFALTIACILSLVVIIKPDIVQKPKGEKCPQKKQD